MQYDNHDAYEEAINSFIVELTLLRLIKSDTTLGCDDMEIQEIMEAQNVKKLPQIYTYFMRKIGKKAGSFSFGDDFLYPSVLDLKQELIETLKITPTAKFQLPEQAFVFWMHNAYQFMYFLPNDNHDNDDPKIFSWMDGMQEAEEIFPFFSKLLIGWINAYKNFKP